MKIPYSDKTNEELSLIYKDYVVSKNEGEHIHNNGMLFLDKIEDADVNTLKEILELNKPEY